MTELQLGKRAIWNVRFQCRPLCQWNDFIDKRDLGMPQQHLNGLASSTQWEIYELQHSELVLGLQFEHGGDTQRREEFTWTTQSAEDEFTV